MLSHEPALRCVSEKGQALLDIVPDSTISDNIKKMQANYEDLCSAAKVLLQYYFKKKSQALNTDTSKNAVIDYLLDSSSEPDRMGEGA